MLSFLLRLFLPQTCAHCRLDFEGTLCPACRSRLERPSGPACARCTAPVPPGRALCRGCDGKVHACRLIRSAFRHAGPARSLAHALKYRGRKAAAEDAAVFMEEAYRGRRELSAREAPWAALVPVPLHRARLVERGYNQAALLAAALSPRLRIPVLDCLERRRATAPLWKLGRRQRRAAVDQAFALRAGLEARAAGARLLLIDDVCTTGSTLEGCARELRRAGAAEVGALTLTRQARPR